MPTSNELFLSQPELIILGQGQRTSEELPSDGFSISGLCCDLDAYRGLDREVPNVASIYRCSRLVHDSGLIIQVFPTLRPASAQLGLPSVRYDLSDKGRTALFAHSLALEVLDNDLSRVFVVPEIVDAVIALIRSRD